jgi:hypothetical protein
MPLSQHAALVVALAALLFMADKAVKTRTTTPTTVAPVAAPAPAPAPVAAPAPAPVATPAPTILDIKESLRAFLLREWQEGGGEERWWVDRVEGNLPRFERLEAAFVAVWGKTPLSQQKLALALCLIETGCGFGETRNWKLRNGEWSRGDRFWNTEVFLSRAGACGVTQVVPQVLGKDCAQANRSYQDAFALQKQWLKERWRYGGAAVNLNGEEWLIPVEVGPAEAREITYLPYRYNGGGKGAWRYGRRWKEAYDGLVLK